MRTWSLTPRGGATGSVDHELDHESAPEAVSESIRTFGPYRLQFNLLGTAEPHPIIENTSI